MIEARVSAIITAYNSAAFIADAIRSILNQSGAVDEILVHNALGKSSMVMLRRSVLVDVGLFSETIRWRQENLSHVRQWERILSYWDISRSAISKSRPIWQRPILLARTWSHFTYRRAKYAIQLVFPRWRHLWYALAAFVVYPFEMTRDKFSAVIRSIAGDGIYRTAKKAFRARLQAGGQR